MIPHDTWVLIFGILAAGFVIFCLIPTEHIRAEWLFRPMLLLAILFLLIAQTTFLCRYPVFGVRLELVPPLILYIALTTNFPTTIAACVFASLLYDMQCPIRLGASLLPYVLSGGVFCMLRPMLYRNSWLTRFISGGTICMMILLFQWIAFRATGAADLPVWQVVRTVSKLSIFGGFLSIA